MKKKKIVLELISTYNLCARCQVRRKKRKYWRALTLAIEKQQYFA